MHAASLRSVLVLMVMLLGAHEAHAWDPRIHALLAERALQGDPRIKQAPLPALSQVELDAFRMRLDGLFRVHGNPKVQAEYVRRWPTPQSFTAVEFKRLMGFNTRVPVHGMDHGDEPAAASMALILRGTTQPALDGRSRDRLALDASGQPRKLPDGRPIPEDPAVLNIGAATGPSSENLANFGLFEGGFSPDPDILKVDVRRYAVPHGWPAGPVLSFAHAYVEHHYNLAVLAALDGTPQGLALGQLFLGQALHYVGQLANQSQSAQLGHHDILAAAHMAWQNTALKTLGGFAGTLPPEETLLLDLDATHRAVATALAQKRILEAMEGKEAPEPITRALAALAQDDGPFKNAVEAYMSRAAIKMGKRGYIPSGEIVAARMMEASGGEAGEYFRHINGALHPRFLQPGNRVESPPEDPDSMLGDLGDTYIKAHVDSFYWLHAKTFARAGTSIRYLYTRFDADTSLADAVDRTYRTQQVASAFLTQRLAALGEAEARLEQFTKDPPVARPASVTSVRWLVGPVLAPVVLLGLLFVIIKWARKSVDAYEEPKPLA